MILTCPSHPGSRLQLSAKSVTSRSSVHILTGMPRSHDCAQCFKSFLSISNASVVCHVAVILVEQSLLVTRLDNLVRLQLHALVETRMSGAEGCLS